MRVPPYMLFAVHFLGEVYKANKNKPYKFTSPENMLTSSDFFHFAPGRPAHGMNIYLLKIIPKV